MSHHAVPVSRLSSVGLVVLGLLFLLAAVLHAQPRPHKLNCPNGIEYSGGCAPDPDAIWNEQDGKPPAKALTPTEVQTLRLQNKQLVAQIAQRDLQAAQQRFQTALVDLTVEADKVKVEQGWPKDTQFSPNDLSFAPAPPPAKDVKKP